MAHGRWYPTVTTLGDGRVMTFSGSDDVTGATNSTVEFYTVGSGWSTPYTALSGRRRYIPACTSCRMERCFTRVRHQFHDIFNPSAHTWTDVATTIFGSTRDLRQHGSAALTPANNYDPKVIIMGGGSPATATTETIDLGASNPIWDHGPRCRRSESR